MTRQYAQPRQRAIPFRYRVDSFGAFEKFAFNAEAPVVEGGVRIAGDMPDAEQLKGQMTIGRGCSSCGDKTYRARVANVTSPQLAVIIDNCLRCGDQRALAFTNHPNPAEEIISSRRRERIRRLPRS